MGSTFLIIFFQEVLSFKKKFTQVQVYPDYSKVNSVVYSTALQMNSILHIISYFLYYKKKTGLLKIFSPHIFLNPSMYSPCARPNWISGKSWRCYFCCETEIYVHKRSLIKMAKSRLEACIRGLQHICIPFPAVSTGSLIFRRSGSAEEQMFA